MAKKRIPATAKKGAAKNPSSRALKPQKKGAVQTTSAKQGRRQKAGPVGVPSAADMIIVGVGASAGGLEAFSQVLEALPPNPGFAIVLVQHLAPQHDSALPFLLSGRTSLQVVQASEGMHVVPNHIYVIPPN